ncbi:hypothetical protein R8871_05001 [Paraburkholderia graminis C4D1M]|uniref:Uncharacterized protein n=1 Tax=Paraburkholderia graminis (strain ATCC 700544 / DSM 17151 / LMG 18924 / NCIMB 13744 / C4D1M) TaxID=396598 RepID=B1G5Q0_PARG4|nr:hypothetical protein BgramDRAFT_4696 [Paraburkholderia graminis C4D1M]CAB3722640.1 hypothetical protein R8871_05001 [Paraburkholderia graminis C4D1M]
MAANKPRRDARRAVPRLYKGARNRAADAARHCFGRSRAQVQVQVQDACARGSAVTLRNGLTGADDASSIMP